MAMNTRRNPLAALLDYANNRGDEAASIGSVMSQLASPILKAQGVQPEAAVQRGPVPQPTLVNTTPAAPAAPVPPLPKTTSDTEEYYIREYQKRGLARPVAEGIVASLNAESGLNPAINERSPVVPGSRGGFGLAQWTGPRRVAFERWAADNGKNINDEQAQIDFTMAEFAGPERAAYDALIQSPDAQSAAAIFTNQFLRPGVPNMEARVNDAARMSGQPYDPAIAGTNINTGISTMGGPQMAGGMMPQTVEGILSTLYPDASGNEKAAHRKDILMGLSQGLSALSQGRPVDLSNIAANADQRRRQYVLDTREKEKAKAAASLVYSQTGDASMAAGIASGAINYTDVLNERQMKRAEQVAQEARLKDAATTDALTSAMKAAKMPQETIDLVQKGGVDALNAYQKIQADQSLLEQEARVKDQQAQNVADAQYILSTAAPGSPEARAAERVVALGGAEEYYTLMKDRAPPAGAAIPDQIEYADALVAGGKYPDRATALQALLANGGNGAGGTANMQDAQALVDSGAVNAATNKPYTLAEAMVATVLTPPAPPNMQYVLGPNNQLMLVPITAAAGGAPTAAGGAPAPTVGGAFGNTFGSVNDAAKAALLPGDLNQQALTAAATEAGTAATNQATAQNIVEAPLDFATKQADLDAKRLANEQALAMAPDAITRSALEVEKADLDNQQAALNAQRTQAETAATLQATTQDTAEAPVDFALLNADLVAKQQANAEKAATTTDTVALSALNVEAADLRNQQLAAQIAQLNADKTVDAQTKQATLAKLNSDAMLAKQAYDTAVATAEQAQIDAEKQSSAEYQTALDEYSRFSRSAEEVMAQGLDAMATGTMGQLYDFTVGRVLESTPRRAFKAKTATMSSQLTFKALAAAKEAGVTLNPLTEGDRIEFTNSMTLLGKAGELDGETIVRETAFQDNMAKDFLFGAKDLTRHDEFGNTYKVGANTLGVTEDTFARHWKAIPPAVKEAWRNGTITDLPTDKPEFAEAANVINSMAKNFSLYQPDIPVDRTFVGIPVPEGVEPELWPDIWAGLSADSKAELTKAAK